MRKFSNLINENIEQAKAFLRRNNINFEDDYIFQVIKDRCIGKEGFIGWLTKIAHEDIKPTTNGWGPVVKQVEEILEKIEKNPNIIRLLDKPVTQQKNLESFIDDFERAKLKYKAKQIYNEFPRIQKNFLNINDKGVISILSKLYDDKNNKVFLRKISSYKSYEELKNGINKFLSGEVNTDFDKILNELEKINSPIIYADENRDLIISRVLTFEQCSIIGAKTSWCIKDNEYTFSSYVNPNLLALQYAIYLTDKDVTDDNRLIGATFNINGFKTAHNVTDQYINYNELQKILKERGFDIKKIEVTKDSIKKIGYDHVTVKLLRKLDIPEEEILKKKKVYYYKDLYEFEKDNIIKYNILDKLNNKNVSIEVLKDNGFCTKEIVEFRKMFKEKELEYFTEDEIKEYDLLNKTELSGEKLVKSDITNEEIIEKNTFSRVIKNTLPIIPLINKLGFDKKYIQENIEMLYPMFNEESKYLYDKYLKKDKIEKLTELQFGNHYADYNDIKKYSVYNTLFIMEWYNIKPSDFKLDELPNIIEKVSPWNIEYVYNPLKKLGYFENLDLLKIFNFFKKICGYSHTNDSETLIMYELFKLGYDTSQLVINYYLKKEDDGTYKRNSNGFYGGITEPIDVVYGYSNERTNRNKIKEMLENYPKEYEKIVYYDNINEFYKYTLAVSKFTWGNERYKPSMEEWLEKYAIPNIELDWNELVGRYRKKCLMGYIILMAYNNKIDDLYKMKGVDWGNDGNHRDWSEDTKLGNLEKIITNTHITNHSATFGIEPELDNDKRYKLYEWTINFVFPSIEKDKKGEFEQDIQLLYFLFDRIALNNFIEKTKKYNLLKKVIDILKPLFEYLLESVYSETFFYKEERFDRLLDLKYYINKVFGNYDKFTQEEWDDIMYLLYKKPHYTNETERYKKSNEIVDDILGSRNPSTKRGSVMGTRVVSERKVMDFYDFVIEKIQDDYFEKNPNFYLSKNKERIKKQKDENEERNKDSEDFGKKIKNVKIEDIGFEYNEQWKEYISMKPDFLINKYLVREGKPGEYFFSVSNGIRNEYDYKVYVAFINKLSKNENITITYIPRDIINTIFENIEGYYSVLYNDSEQDSLFLTKKLENYKTKIKELKNINYVKIIYTNYNIKGKVFTDYNSVIKTKVRNKLKNISYEDIYFTNKEKIYYIHFKDNELDKLAKSSKLVPYEFFTKEPYIKNKEYFGHLRNRYHIISGLGEEVKGIGLGYKIYKAFLKQVGYIISDEQTSTDARKIYYNLLKDDDIYHIIDRSGEHIGQDYSTDSEKILLIWKDYPKKEKLISIIRKNELNTKRKYKYDKELMKYVSNIKIK